MYGRSRSTCLSSIPSQRTTSGGVPASRTGGMSSRRGRSSASTPSHTCPPSSASTTCPTATCARGRLSARGEHGIAAFCYFHYWFEGRRPLREPLDEVLVTGLPSLHFCRWANENWMRVWDGLSGGVLVEQRLGAAPRFEVRHADPAAVAGRPRAPLGQSLLETTKSEAWILRRGQPEAPGSRKGRASTLTTGPRRYHSCFQVEPDRAYSFIRGSMYRR